MLRRAATALVLTAVTACGAPAADGPADARTGTLRVQAAGGEGELSALRELVAAYEAARSGVDVAFTGVPDQGDHIAKLSTAFAGGKPPDVFLLNYRRLGPFVERGVLAPVRLTSLSLVDLHVPSVDAFRYDGDLACLPQNASSSVAYVNEELFARAGLPLPGPVWTWDDLEAAARSLAAKGIAAVGFAPEIRTVAPFVWTAGGEVVDDTEAPTAITLDTREAREALSYLVGLQAHGVDAVSRAAVDPADQFAAGELAVFVDSRRSVPAFRKAGVPFDVRPIPRAEPARPSVSLLASDAYCVSKASEKPSLAADFVEYAVGPEGGEVLARSGRTVPALRSLSAGPAFLDPAQRPRSSQVFLDVIPTLRRLPNVGPQDEAEEAANDLLAQLFAGKADLARTVREIRTATAAAYEQG